MSVRIVISIGDYNGIGPEVVLKTLQQLDTAGGITPVMLGSVRIIEHYLPLLERPLEYRTADRVQEVVDGEVNVLNCLDERDIDIRPGTLSTASGRCAMRAVEKGIELCTSGLADALVTAPISKEAVNRAGYDIPGHTEFLADKTGASDFIMMMVNNEKKLRIGLLSTHIPLADVGRWLKEERIVRYAGIMQKSLINDFGIPDPGVAILGVNPHAGDGGMIGNEEIEVITPAIGKLQKQGIRAYGPFPPDGFFGNRSYRNYDAVLAMYHDQGLIPFKTLSFGTGVNFTAGLPIIRTSPDHGTAFDIAGRGQADPDSFGKAFDLAVELARKRKKEGNTV